MEIFDRVMLEHYKETSWKWDYINGYLFYCPEINEVYIANDKDWNGILRADVPVDCMENIRREYVYEYMGRI